MLDLISAILFSFSANLDNIAIGISYGIKKIHIPNVTTFFIAIFTTIFTLISMMLGRYIILFLDETIANSIGSYLLVLLGSIYIVKEIFESLSKNKRSDDENEIIKTKNITNIKIKELIVVVFMLSINNIGAGIAASATGMNILLTCIFSFLFSYIFLLFGNNLGRKVTGNYIEKYCNIISSIILILIGIMEF